ncbi:MAG: flagellar export chaperone FlgN [Spirochaetia bacterium]
MDTNLQNIAEQLSKTLSEQIRSLTDLAENLTVVRDALFQKNWINLERIMRRNTPLVEEFEKLEYDRNRILESAQNELDQENVLGDDSLSQLYSRISGETRRELEEKRRKMKILVSRISALSEGIEFYVRTTAKTLGNVLDELFPVRRGKLYSKSGKTAGPGEMPMVVNRAL